MTIATIGEGWWKTACDGLDERSVTLRPAVEPPANPYSADAAARLGVGREWLTKLRDEEVEVLLDNGGMGLGFVTDDGAEEQVKLVHEMAGVPLLSHWIDPLVTVFQGLPWVTVWQCLQSQQWFKFMWDGPQAAELQAFGIPQVYRLPMAACDREYKTDRLVAAEAKYAISFVGGQNTTYFDAGHGTTGDALLLGTLAQAVRGSMPEMSFFEIYYDLYRFGERPVNGEPLESRTRKAFEYFNHKLFYNATQCIRQRDRFVVFLKRKLGETFKLVGRRWDQAYGLECEPPIETDDGYYDHFRKSAINLNLVNGNSDSGLNMRHFEITAAGGFLLSYHQPEIESCFEVGRECDTFRNEQELLEKIQYYLEHPDVRIEIAAAGQRRTLSEHLYSHRLRSMLNVARSVAESVRALPDPPTADGSDGSIPDGRGPDGSRELLPSPA